MKNIVHKLTKGLDTVGGEGTERAATCERADGSMTSARHHRSLITRGLMVGVNTSSVQIKIGTLRRQPCAQH